LFGPRQSSKKTIFIKVAMGSLLSASMGALGWGLGLSLGKEIWMLLPWTLLPTPLVQSSDTFHYIALYLVWQPIMALFIGAVAERGTSSAEPRSLGTTATL
jgi:hypothetical protein